MQKEFRKKHKSLYLNEKIYLLYNTFKIYRILLGIKKILKNHKWYMIKKSLNKILTFDATCNINVLSSIDFNVGNYEHVIVRGITP